MTRKTPVVKDAIPDIEDLQKKSDDTIPNQTETCEKKPEPTNQLKKNLLKTELKNDVIPRKKMGRPKKEVLRNEKGERLTKKGTVDKRGETGLQNLQKSRVYQQILENKKLRKTQTSRKKKHEHNYICKNRNKFVNKNLKNN